MKQAQFDIISSCQISSTQVLVNQQCLLQRSSEADWLSFIYKNLEISYPKFFKMDRLCKAGILGSECLLKNYPFDKENVKTSWGIILCNSASSLDNDRKYQETIQTNNYYPSPSVFVYTLANIVTGEMAIKNKIGGETSFYILPHYDVETIQTLINQSYIANQELDHLIGGWLNVDDQEIDVRLMLTQRKSL